MVGCFGDCGYVDETPFPVRQPRTQQAELRARCPRPPAYGRGEGVSVWS